MASKTVAVSIINYNSKDYLQKLLKVFYGQKNLEIWVIDNLSPDKGGKDLKKEFPKINLIESKENGGFAKGHNLALRKIDTDYVLIINPDVEIPNQAVEEMVEFMENNPDCGVASCKISGFDNTPQSNGGDLPLGLPLFAWLFNLEMIPGLENITGNFHRVDDEYYVEKREVGWVGGTFMFVKNEVFKKVGFLPEDYFMYVEDVDFCYEVRNKGYKIMINPKLTIKHQGGASSKDPHLAQFKGEVIGLEIFYKKYFGEFSMLMIKILLYISTILRIAAFTLIGKSNIAQTYWKVLSYV